MEVSTPEIGGELGRMDVILTASGLSMCQYTSDKLRLTANVCGGTIRKHRPIHCTGVG